MIIQQVKGMRTGLTIKKRLVELMQGREFMDSAPEQGTSFKSALACAGKYFFFKGINLALLLDYGAAESLGH